MFSITKNQFRAIIVGSIIFAVLSGVYDYVWPNPVTEEIIDFIIEVEPAPQGAKLIAVVILGGIVVLMALVSLAGLLLFKSWARHVYVASFIAALGLYPLMGISVYGGMGQMFYDLSMVMSGVLLALMYYSPVAEYFETKS